MSANTNVVVFPKGKKDSPPQSIDEIISGVMDARCVQIEIVSDDLTDYLMYALAEEGFDVYGEEVAPSIVLINHAIRAAMLKTLDMDHPLISLADDLFTEEDEVEDDNS